MLDTDNFKEEIDSNEKTLVEFGASWCMPCKMVATTLDNLAEKYRVMKIDVDEEPVITSEYSIASVPTFLVFQNGEIINKAVGAMNQDALEDLLK